MSLTEWEVDKEVDERWPNMQLNFVVHSHTDRISLEVLNIHFELENLLIQVAPCRRYGHT
jgi:hypothetical protein